MTTVDTTDRMRGTLLGLAWGDVYGCPVEGWSASEIKQVFGEYASLPEDYPWPNLAHFDKKRLKRLRPLGLHSDDTQQALGLLHVVLSGAWSDAAWAEMLVEGMVLKAWRGYGRNFASAVTALKKGTPPHAAGSSSAGIGSAMRIAPIGAVLFDDSQRLADVVMRSSLITHGDIRAAAIAFAVAWAAARLVGGHDAAVVRSGLSAAVRAVEDEWLHGHLDWKLDRSAGNQISDALGVYFDRPSDTPAAIRERVSELGRPFLADGFTRAHPNQGFALLGGLHGLAMALRDVGGPQDSLQAIVVEGFDTDTVAAIAGGLLGARFGSGWIASKRLLDIERLTAWAAALSVRSSPPESREALLAAEAGWTRVEQDFQKKLAT
jgi:ADP-ribosyl-[dinitrogen reductase] hydrolase